MVSGGRLEMNILFFSRTDDRIEFHSIPFQSIPFHVLPNAQILKLLLATVAKSS